MTDWINLDAIWKIVVIGLACGAGLPAVFAVGLKALALAEGDTVTDGGAATAEARSPLLMGAAGLCFAVVLAAIGAGIYLIVSAT